MPRITISYDDGPEAALDAVCGVLNTLGIKYKHVDDDCNVHIDYEVPPALLSTPPNSDH